MIAEELKIGDRFLCDKFNDWRTVESTSFVGGFIYITVEEHSGVIPIPCKRNVLCTSTPLILKPLA